MIILLLIILLQIGIASWLIHYLVSNDRGPKEPPKILFVAGLLGFLAVIIGLIAEIIIIPTSSLPSLDHPELRVPIITLLLATLAVGVIEETAKALPLGLLIYKKGYFNEFTDGIIYFGIAGMIFGMIESIGYTLSFGAATGITRAIINPFMHAGFSCIIGYALIRHKLLRKSSWSIAGGATLAIMLHMLYDFGLFYRQTWSILASFVIGLLVNFGLFRLYRHATHADITRGLSTTGVNRFCRNCGYPNPGGTLFCTHCGKHT